MYTLRQATNVSQNPTVLHSFLRNIFLHLPENYELISGTKFENIHLYYDLIKVTKVENIHRIKFMNVPIKTVNQHFTLYKVIDFPAWISENKFVKYSLDFRYFGLSRGHLDYVLLTGADFKHCSMSSLAICQIGVAL